MFLVKMVGMIEHACNPNVGKRETEECLGLSLAIVIGKLQVSERSKQHSEDES